jgi:transcriptional regulator with XRE-family HTH domain
MESLAEYLVRVMRQKDIDLIELAKRSGLTDSYIGRLRNGTLKNPTVETMVKLATGLEVNAHEVFTAASGVPVSATASIDPLMLLEQMQKLVSDPVGFDVLRRLLSVPPNERQAALGYLDYFKSKAQSDGKPHKQSD